MQRAELRAYARRLARSEAFSGLNLVVLSTVDSTNRLARAVVSDCLDSDQEVPPVAVVAWEQSAGRGRQGRSWVSPPGAGAYVSLVLPLAGRESLTRLPLAVAVGLAEAISELCGRACRIKWPNDLLVAGRKIGGVLIEAVHRGERWAAVAGFGVNHSQREEDLPIAAATSLALECDDGPPALTVVIGRLVSAVRTEVAAAGEAGLPLVERFSRLSVHRPGERLRCRLPDTTVEGRFIGFDDAGQLRIAVDGEERAVAAADVVTA